jgi:hypothetical protein
MSFYFLTEFFKYFFRVLHEAGSSWLKLAGSFWDTLYPVVHNAESMKSGLDIVSRVGV